MKGDGNYVKVPISEATVMPEDGDVEVFRNCYWAATDDDCILFYRGYSPQCNANKEVTERIAGMVWHPATKVVFLPWAYRKKGGHQ